MSRYFSSKYHEGSHNRRPIRQPIEYEQANEVHQFRNRLASKGLIGVSTFACLHQLCWFSVDLTEKLWNWEFLVKLLFPPRLKVFCSRICGFQSFGSVLIKELLVLSFHQMDSILSAAECIFCTALSPSRVWSLLIRSSLLAIKSKVKLSKHAVR